MAEIELLAGKKIIIADDEEFIRSHLAKRLGEIGLTVLEAATGQQVLDLLEQLPDLILMDVMMPEVDGFETTRIIRSEKKSEIPIILLSALAGKDDIEKGIKAGADEFLCKPVTFSVILDSIAKKLVSLQIS